MADSVDDKAALARGLARLSSRGGRHQRAQAREDTSHALPKPAVGWLCAQMAWLVDRKPKADKE